MRLAAMVGALLCGVSLFAGTTVAAEATAEATANTTLPRGTEGIAQLVGEWTVDLRPSLADAAYTQPMVLAIAEDGRITGSFYHSEILAGRVGRGQGRVCIAFRTTDGAGLYHSAACLVDGKLVGQTWAEHRNFVLPWTAVATVAPSPTGSSFGPAASLDKRNFRENRVKSKSFIASI